MSSTHRWTFFRAGDFDQVKLETGEDLVHIHQLDQKLWVALACPASGLEIDGRTLALIDTDKDGRIRAPELIAGISFAVTNLKNPDDLFKRARSLPLAAINDKTTEGATLLASARQILSNLGKAETTEIDVDDVGDPTKIFANTRFNGDGVITELSATDETAKAAIRDIITCLGSDPDRSGLPGITQEKIDTFFEEVRLYGVWLAQAAADSGHIWPLGPTATAAAAAAIKATKPKVDDYFGRCRLAAFDPRTIPLLNRKEEDYQEVASSPLSITADEVADFPLAVIAPGKPLPLEGAVNPAHAAALATLRRDAVTPLLGDGDHATLDEAEWAALQNKVADYFAWQDAHPALRANVLGDERLVALAAAGVRDALTNLMAQDKALEKEATSLDNVERLVRYHRDLVLLCTNFINFRDFYDGGQPAIFQAGTLYLDRRSCGLCLPVDDPAKHASMAALAGACLVYLDCWRKATGEKRQIVAAFTAGDSDNLMVGRNGLFYDRQGHDWDATITKIIDNPISLRQAFWSPYKKFVRFLEEQIAKRAAAHDAEAHGKLNVAATSAVNVDRAKPAEPKKLDVGTVAALGVAVGAIGTFVTALVGYLSGVLQLGVLATVGAIIGVIAAISAPSMILAFIKLRKRNLGPILDANGWAVNAKARISVPFGRTLTGTAHLPKGSRRDRRDPYAEKRLPWKRLLLLAVLIYGGCRWYQGRLDRFLPQAARSHAVLGGWAPAPAPAAPLPEAPPKGATK
ncbi:MAG: hypothetical protein QOI66_310 [Myxococcales bacterium]|jgi:hypothetical protein|nr:hypothetical protein [Myxococcales bacterium]